MQNARPLLWRKQTGKYNTEGWCYYREGAINIGGLRYEEFTCFILGLFLENELKML